ncbi:MAG: 2,3-bisphosphoglycerate-independent phosphoglycerate mutase [Deltaproteobacteria bacterium]|jgi:2,3-bisphosphoglycerate-independent phosphoglycerate mutase|nr:2,3-bisphosphoglycerate-independent phosphoglycerate mutase [Deltaproteobacteria bacterium]
MPIPTLLLILDGYGLAPDGPGNAVFLAQTPNIKAVYSQPGVAILQCGGRDVGLPAGYMGNSEVGHLNIGSGRIVYQDMTRIDIALENGELARHPLLLELLERTRSRGGRLHFLGLLSDAGVHSHIAHLEALIDIAAAHEAPVLVHPIMDGRDTSPHAGADFMERLVKHLHATNAGRVASFCGRFYAMDRDKRWDRVQAAWEMLLRGQGEPVADPVAALRAAYAQDETDEFIKPRIVGDRADGLLRDNDSIVFFNFRADRARELVHVFEDTGFAAFDRGAQPDLAGMLCMVPYDESLHEPVLFEKENLDQTMGEVVSDFGMRQLRIAETEKYAHVTYFFSGGREELFPGEERILVPSPRDVATYDLKPAMSVHEVTDKLVAAWQTGQYQFVVCNLANPDMVGHTGNMPAVLEALAAVDQCVGRIAAAVIASGGRLVLVSDHGNADEMIAPDGEPSTAHSHNPVRLAIQDAGRPVPLQPEGRLADIAPTLLDLWDIKPPARMTGRSLKVAL